MSQRKLLQEIDKVFKKVKEGLEIFDGYYDKLQNCESQSQKEKIEGDLKREIKKLQRQRDQIKNWLSGNDVKDKNNLLENRRLIENAMERFKTVEKDMKTKAFSKEGLSMQRIDPKEKEKNDTSEFLHQQLEELERQCEKHEANIDQIHSSVKKGKKLDNSKQQEVDDLNEKISRNHWHQEKMELILRLLANDDIECDQVNALQEDIKYYVDTNEDVDFIEDEGIYDELELEDIEDMYGNVGDYPHANEEAEHEAEPPVQTASPQKKQSVGAQPAPAPISTNNTAATISNQPPQATKPPGLSSVPLSNNTATTSTTTSHGLSSLRPSVAPLKTDLKYSSVLSAGVNSSTNTPTAAVSSNSNTPVLSNATLTRNGAANGSTPPPPPGLTNTISNTTESRETTQSPVLIPNGFQDLVASYEKTKQSIANPKPFEEISKILETSLLNCPDSLDADRPKVYLPKEPHPTSIYYPQEPLPELSFTSIVAKLDENTLFYNFYYDQGKYIQVESANELARRGWKFNKSNKKWFKRFEDDQPAPSLHDKTNTAEKKYFWKYFDYEDTWLSRRKDDFTPDYEQLITNF